MPDDSRPSDSEQGSMSSEKGTGPVWPATDPLIVGPSSGKLPAEQERVKTAEPSAAELVKRREQEFATLLRITEEVNAGVTLEDVLDTAYGELRRIIPYDRIGLSLISDDGERMVARWARSDRPILLGQGYEAPLEGSTLQDVFATGRPRIINDLAEYLRHKPESESTEIIVREGMRSSLTCPLIVRGDPLGVLFFSSLEIGTYSDVHVAFFLEIAGLLSTAIENGRLYSELADQKAVIEKHNQAMVRELDMARQVQMALIPQATLHIDGLDIAFEYQPTMQIGGDVLDIIELDRSRVLFFVGDAMGHGVQAALIMAVAKTALQAAVQDDPNPTAVLASINRMIEDVCDETFVTGAACLVDRAAERVEFALAGQAWPCVYSAERDEVTHPGDVGLPLGVEDDSSYRSVEIPFRQGDTIVFCTDGVFEAVDWSKVIYGYERFEEQLRTHAKASPGDLITAITSDVAAHCKGRPPQDDFTLLAIQAVASSGGVR